MRRSAIGVAPFGWWGKCLWLTGALNLKRLKRHYAVFCAMIYVCFMIHQLYIGYTELLTLPYISLLFFRGIIVNRTHGAHKTLYILKKNHIFTENIWSCLLWSPVVARKRSTTFDTRIRSECIVMHTYLSVESKAQQCLPWWQSLLLVAFKCARNILSTKKAHSLPWYQRRYICILKFTPIYSI